MLKGVANLDNGRKLVIIGLSDKNIRLLQENKPIPILGTEMDVEFDILVFAGSTEKDLLDKLREFIGPNTKIDIDPRYTTEEKDNEKKV
jgi:hypothetical protein